MATSESLPRRMECVGPARLIGLPTAVVGAVIQTHACKQMKWVILTQIVTLSSAAQTVDGIYFASCKLFNIWQPKGEWCAYRPLNPDATLPRRVARHLALWN